MPEKDKKEKNVAVKKADNKPAAKTKKKRKSLLRIFKDTVQEGKKVSWPSKKDWINHSIVVTAFVIVVMAVVFAIDSGLTFLLQLAL